MLRTDRQTDGRMDGRTDNVKTVYPLQTKFAGGIITNRLCDKSSEFVILAGMKTISVDRK